MCSVWTISATQMTSHYHTACTLLLPVLVVLQTATTCSLHQTFFAASFHICTVNCHCFFLELVNFSYTVQYIHCLLIVRTCLSVCFTVYSTCVKNFCFLSSRSESQKHDFSLFYMSGTRDEIVHFMFYVWYMEYVWLPFGFRSLIALLLTCAK